MDDMLDTAPCGFLSFDDEGTITRVNRTLLEMLGYEPAEVQGKKLEGILTMPNRIFFQTHFFPMVKLHGRAEEIFLQLRTRAGENLPVLANAVRREGPEGCRNDCVFIPVPHRRKYEDEILSAKRTAERALQNNETLAAAKQELERQTQELDRKINRLEQKNNELTRISSILSHDLREPVRKINLFTDILSRDNWDHLTPSGRRAAEKVTEECARADKLLQRLREYISLDIGSETPSRVDLNEVLRKALAQAQESADTSLSVRSEQLPVIEGYESQLRAMFSNLLDNALKFRRPEVAPEVTIECTLIPYNSFSAIEGKYHYVDFAKIIFSDNGIGIEEKYSSYIFRMLTKIDRHTPGLGCGLAICKKVAENHYGSITMESSPGPGTRFTILLPLKP